MAKRKHRTALLGNRIERGLQLPCGRVQREGVARTDFACASERVARLLGLRRDEASLATPRADDSLQREARKERRRARRTRSVPAALMHAQEDVLHEVVDVRSVRAQSIRKRRDKAGVLAKETLGVDRDPSLGVPAHGPILHGRAKSFTAPRKSERQSSREGQARHTPLTALKAAHLHAWLELSQLYSKGKPGAEPHEQRRAG